MGIRRAFKWCRTKGPAQRQRTSFCACARGGGGRCVLIVSCTEDSRRLVARPAFRGRARICVVSMLVVFAVWLVTAASATAFTANGSAKQVYATGLAPNAQVSLLKQSGAIVYTQN